MAPPKSKVWAYFTKTNETAATCKRCFKTVKYCGNTSNLFKHAHGTVVNKKQQKNADKDRNESSKSTTVSANSADIMGVDESQSSTSRTFPKKSNHDEAGSSICIEDNNRIHLRNTLQEAFARVSSNKEGGAKYNRIVEALIFFICKYMRPFNVVQGEGFLRLMKEVEPTFKLPSAKYLKKRTVEKFDACTASCKLRLSKVDNICLTLDIWTETMNESSFLGVH